VKQLFWKEWRELRLLPLGAALTVALALAAVKATTRYYHDPFPRPADVEGVLLVGWPLFAVLAGAGLFSQEIGTGTLAFLSSLPVSRRTLWWVKAATALGALLLSLLASGLTWTALCWLWSPQSPLAMWNGGETAPGRMIETFSFVGMVTLALLFCLSVSLAVSPLFDRSLTASIFGVLACVAVVLGHSALVSGVRHGDGALWATLLALSTLTFGAASFYTWTRGESLRGPKRYGVAARTAAAGLAVGAAVVFTGRLFWLW